MPLQSTEIIKCTGAGHSMHINGTQLPNGQAFRQVRTRVRTRDALEANIRKENRAIHANFGISGAPPRSIGQTVKRLAKTIEENQRNNQLIIDDLTNVNCNL